MNSERVSSWLSLVANFGVLVGLVLLIVEIRDNTLTTQAVLQQENLNYMQENAALLLADENKELASIFYRGETDPDSLSPGEFRKFIHFVSMQMAAWETAFLNYDQGLIADRFWRATDAGFSSVLQQGSGYRRWWEMSRDSYDAGFQDHVDQAFEHMPRKGPDCPGGA